MGAIQIVYNSNACIAMHSACMCALYVTGHGPAKAGHICKNTHIQKMVLFLVTGRDKYFCKFYLISY